MNTNEQKALAAQQEARRHEVLAKLADEPGTRKEHLDAAALLMEIAGDYGSVHGEAEA